jgi:hypothetical protein
MYKLQQRQNAQLGRVLPGESREELDGGAEEDLRRARKI